jgi:dTDP-4-dehydrorhamnose 3,5-epimerase
MKVRSTELPEVLIIEPTVYGDARGYFLETYHVQKYRQMGLSVQFVQDNYSHSSIGILRGLHAQVHRQQGKLIWVMKGEIFDVAVDIRRGSKTFGQWTGLYLSAENFRQCYIPPGFAHGYCVVSEEADVVYKCTDFYDPTDELTIQWKDPEINISWPIPNPMLSEKDLKAPPLADVIDQLPAYEGVPQ